MKDMALQSTVEHSSARALHAGLQLARPPLGEEVVITGMAGRFPKSDDVYQYRENIFNKMDMVTADNSRWELVNSEIPERCGKINSIEKFDAGFFGIHSHQAAALDVGTRQLIEKAFEAIVDAGYNPKELQGSRTGVFIGCSKIDSEKTWFYNKLESPNFGITGSTRSVQPQWIGKIFGLVGPSISVDTACSSSVSAFEHAYTALREGRCDGALVGAANLCLIPMETLQLSRLGVLSKDGACKSFDENANGYVRSEAVSVIYLQKAKDARRIYAQVVHCKLNCDGYKEQGITFPSGPTQKQLLAEIYRECEIDPTTIDFLEAHATGTKVGDPEETMAMDEIFCKNRKTPLYIGSIKSNLGHTESVSGLCSIVKVLLSMENHCFIPNIRYTKSKIEALKKGRMVVVTEKMPWISGGSGLAAINNFGFGGANGHVVLKRFHKQKINGGQPTDDLPRLVCVSGRTEESITSILDDFQKRELDAEFVRLLHEVFSKDIEAHSYRGYAIISKSGELSRSLSWFEGKTKPLCLVFSGPSEQLLKFGNQLLAIPVFFAAFQKIHDILLPKGMNITEIVNKNMSAEPADVMIGSIVVQIALVDMLNTLQVHSDYIIGYSIGEVAAAYTDGAITLQQAALVAYQIYDCVRNITNGITVYYQVELNENVLDIQTIIPADVKIVDHNSKNGCTISGPAQRVGQFIDCLKSKGISSKVAQSTFGSHLRKYSEEIGTKLLPHLQQILSEPKKRSPKWITTSIIHEQLTSELGKSASAKYFLNNLLNPVLFNEALTMVPRRSVLLNIGLKIKQQDYTNVLLTPTHCNLKNYIQYLLGVLGRLYELGYNPKLDKLYPKVHWPVTVNTPMLSPLIKWNFTEDWFVPFHKNEHKLKTGERKLNISVKESEWAFLSGHVIDGRNLIPPMGYLTLVWETFTMTANLTMSNMQIVFENVRFHRATNVPKTGHLTLFITIQKTTNEFEVAELGETIVTGRIFAPINFCDNTIDLPVPTVDSNEIPLTTKDIYKELKLRGYNYTGAFRGLIQCNIHATKGLIEWKDNWIAFMDNMLQMKILQEGTRNLCVLTYIEQLTIDAKAHIQYATQLGENPKMPVYVYKEPGIIRSGGVQIRGLMESSIPRRKPKCKPVLESLKFIPLEAKLPLEQAIRFNTQLILENSHDIKLRTVEVLDEATRNGSIPIGPIIYQVLDDEPLIQPEITILSEDPLDLENVVVKDRKLDMESNEFSLVIISNIFSRPQILNQALNSLKYNGFILSREDISFNSELAEKHLLDLNFLTVYETSTEKIVLFRKYTASATPAVIDISNDITSFNWLPTLQVAVRNSKEVLVIAQNDIANGILGFIKCLRREPEGSNVRCIFVIDDAPKFDVNNEFYSKQLGKELAINVFKDGKWGTYRHLLLEQIGLVKSEHIFNDITVKGDLSSLRWLEGPLTSDSLIPPEKLLVHVYYASINFRHILTASGRISSNVITKERLEQGVLQGFEFSGRNSNGKRVMGLVRSGALASMVIANSYLVFEIPDEWSMEDAATVPITYSTVLHSLMVIGRLKPRQSILIHAGTGGVGQAAINVALYYKCNVFTTVGSQEKRDFIRKNFPQILNSHIGNSRDTSFEQMVLKETEGRGVDLVLNSLAEEKLQASVRCLAPGGKFIEIGRFDLECNNKLDPELFTKGRSFSGVMLDAFFDGGDCVLQNAITKLLNEGLKTGCVKPLPRTVFKEDEVEQAFRYMASGKHIGKVVINLCKEENQKEIVPEQRLFSGLQRFYCNPNNCYIIVGGLGGFGMELADWFVLRGAKKLVLTSRQGLTTSYQSSRIRIWKSYDVKTYISTADITTREGCIAMINEAKTLGPIEGIFNLAIVLQDALLENQDKEKYSISLAPKALATKHLDVVTREMCPDLMYFVVFSSVTSGRGNMGQTNYGMANSIMERICEQRKKEGYPALAIQWGAVGEVGLTAEMQELQTEIIEIRGTMQQTISSCIEVMDTFMKQDEPIVSSMVVAEKKVSARGAHSITDVIMDIIGIHDTKSIGLHTTLSELGIDSIMAVEIKHIIEREYETSVSVQDIRGMTLTRLREIADRKGTDGIDNNTKVDKNNNRNQRCIDIDMFIPIMMDEEETDNPVIRLPSLVNDNGSSPKVILLPGIDGTPSILESLTSNLSSQALSLHYPYRDRYGTTIENLAHSLLPHLVENLANPGPFTIVAYSFGSVVAMHMVSLLENEGHVGNLILIDGSPMMCRQLALSQTSNPENEAILQTLILCSLMRSYVPVEVMLSHKDNIYNCKTFEDRIETMLNYVPKTRLRSKKYQKEVCRAAYHRIKALLIYKPKFHKLKSRVKLFKPSSPILTGLEHDYELQSLCENPVEINILKGNHLSILENPQLGRAINKITGTNEVYFN